jgi:hypothetical protein
MMGRLPFFSIILAVGCTAVGAHAQIPSFVREGLAVTYAGYIGTPHAFDPYPQGLTFSTQQITVNTLTSGFVSGTTVVTNYLQAPAANANGVSSVVQGSTKVTWTCSRTTNKCGKTTNPSNAIGVITQFWIDPTHPLNSILTPEEGGLTSGKQYMPYQNPNPTNVSPPPPALAMTCPSISGNPRCIVYDELVSPGGNQPVNICKECLLLAFDWNGFVQYSSEWIQPQNTLSGPVGELIYSLYPSIRWQVDGTSIVLQNDSGQIAIWRMNDDAIVGGGSPGDPGPSWRVLGTGDFYGNHLVDILLQKANGDLAIWETDGAKFISGGNVLFNPGPGWQVGSVINSEIVFQNSDGRVAIWPMNGTALIDIANPGPNWHIVGTGDLNQDNQPDILLQNDSGEVTIWYMTGTTHTISGSGSPANPGPSWHVMGVGDFYRRGFLCDILLQNDSGEVAIWAMDRTTPTIGGGGSPPNPGPSWHVKGVGDYYGHGFHSDILLQNDSGNVVIWDMIGAAIGDGGSPANPGPNWHL